jgi:predicted ATPase
MASPDRSDLSRVQLRNYRSIAEATVDLGPLLVLVGPNGSGKSNFLDALRLVSDALQTSLDQALRNRGGIGEVRRRSTGHPTHFTIMLEFATDERVGRYEFEVAAVRSGGFRIARELCELWRKDADIGARAEWSFQVKDGVVAAGSESVMPPAASDRLYLVAAAGIDVFRPVFDGLSGISVYSVNPDAMREPQTPGPGELLRRDGSNIASVLHRLESEGHPGRTEIDEYLQLVVPGIHHVQRTPLGSWETVEFSQDVPGAKSPWRFPAGSVSDGTLRALGVLVALFSSTGRTFSPVGIEEPESALHPAATAVLLDALRDASTRRQVIVTSHSPDLLDRHDFDPAEIRAVRSEGGATNIAELDQAGLLALRDRLFTPGELLRNDQLVPAPREIA